MFCPHRIAGRQAPSVSDLLLGDMAVAWVGGHHEERNGQEAGRTPWRGVHAGSLPAAHGRPAASRGPALLTWLAWPQEAPPVPPILLPHLGDMDSSSQPPAPLITGRPGPTQAGCGLQAPGPS